MSNTPDPPAQDSGEREIKLAEAEIVRRIFGEFAAGQSPRHITHRLNAEQIPGPDGRPWGDTTIRGQPDCGTGLLNDTLYIGRLSWNRCSYVKDPRTGRRIARVNDRSQWEEVEIPHLRIIDQDLWDRAKTRQQTTQHQMAATDDGNALKRAHRRGFLLSGLLVCGSCSGGDRIVGKDRYGCAPATTLRPSPVRRSSAVFCAACASAC